jgi:2-polyprenyl-3-methyl-5-hydroxy-6-metoxy-1,4-benzoquinol methylase
MAAAENRPLNIEELMSRVRNQAWGAVADVLSVKRKVPPPDSAQLDSILTDVSERSGPRTKFPDSLNRFPFSRLKPLQKAVLRGFDLLSFDQRFTNKVIVAAIRELRGMLLAEHSQLSEWVKAVERSLSKNKKLSKQTQRRIGVLEAEIAALRDARRIDSAEPMLADEAYERFENQFRGSPEQIKARVRDHVTVFKTAGAGTREMPILDLGSGRGEWLEVLKESGLVASGVDINQRFIDSCTARGLDVSRADLLLFLRQQPEQSLGGVTALQVIEHLPFESILELFRESLRVLKPGGLALFETPNTHNLYVLAHAFYLDPSHRRPLPPPMVEFFAREAGFERVELRFLNRKRAKRASSGQPALDELLNDYFDGAQDYALIGWKPK